MHCTIWIKLLLFVFIFVFIFIFTLLLLLLILILILIFYYTILKDDIVQTIFLSLFFSFLFFCFVFFSLFNLIYFILFFLFSSLLYYTQSILSSQGMFLYRNLCQYSWLSIFACHVKDRGSNPRQRVHFFVFIRNVLILIYFNLFYLI